MTDSQDSSQPVWTRRLLDEATIARMRELSSMDFRREFDAEFSDRIEYPVRDRVKLLIAGSRYEASLYKRHHGLTWSQCRYISTSDSVRGCHPGNVEFVRVGRWMENPLVRCPLFDRFFPQWRDSPIWEPPINNSHVEFAESVRINIHFDPSRVNEAFRGLNRILESPEFQQAMADSAASIAEVGRRYGKSFALSIEQWCAENGYTDLFCQEGEWWAFPPNGVMPVQVRRVMRA
jgi:hypothetical protein